MSSCPQKTQSCGFLVKHSLVYRNFTPKLCLWLLIFERVEIYFWVHDQSHKGRVGRKPASYLRTVHWELEKQMVSPTRQRENTKGVLINSMGRHSGKWLEPRDLRPAYIVCWECREKTKQNKTQGEGRGSERKGQKRMISVDTPFFPSLLRLAGSVRTPLLYPDGEHVNRPLAGSHS